MAEASLRFEQILERLTSVVTRLESGELPLEDALAEFEEGVRLSRMGAAMLDQAERKIEVLLRDATGNDKVAPMSEPAAPARDDDIPF